MSRTVSPEEQERIAEFNARLDGITTLAEQCSHYMLDHQLHGDYAEALLLVKATKPDGRRVESVLRMHNWFLGVGVDMTPVSLAQGKPAGETVSCPLPLTYRGRHYQGIPNPHHEIPLPSVEDAVFLTSDLETGRPRRETSERREVSEISRDRYEQLSGQRLD